MAAKRRSLVWESWEDAFVIQKIEAGTDGRTTADLFVAEFPERRRTESSVQSRFIVLRDRLTQTAHAKARPAIQSPAPSALDAYPPALPPPAPRPESVAEKGWRKVAAPKKWQAAEGEVLEGIYLGRKAAEGKFGPYHQHMIAVDGGSGRVVYVTGTVIDGLFVASLAQPGVQVRVVYLGKKESQTSDNEFKDFELFVKEPT